MWLVVLVVGLAIGVYLVVVCLIDCGCLWLFMLLIVLITFRAAVLFTLLGTC